MSAPSTYPLGCVLGEADRPKARGEIMVDKALFHVVGVVGVHPHNTWVKREDGLYDLSGSIWAFADHEAKRCTRANWSEECRCWTRPDGTHVCPREDCED